jgi:ABC-type branched-subunit amino acid transport system substrate-binding protein
VAASGVNVLAFSNNASIAGGNVFVLGQTFDNTAKRLASYAVRSGKGKIMIVHDRNVAGELGKAAIERVSPPRAGRLWGQLV